MTDPVATLSPARPLLLTGYSLGRSASRPAPNSAYPESAWTRIGAPQVVSRPVESHPADRAPSAVPLGGAPSPESAPSRTPGHTLTGTASWYCKPGWSACTVGYRADGLFAAAGPRLRSALGPGWRGHSVTLWAGNRSVTVQLVDWCACPGRLVDLYAAAFSRLAPLSVGVITVRWSRVP